MFGATSSADRSKSHEHQNMGREKSNQQTVDVDEQEMLRHRAFSTCVFLWQTTGSSTRIIYTG
jgi:hypothetical protein